MSNPVKKQNKNKKKYDGLNGLPVSLGYLFLIPVVRVTMQRENTIDMSCIFLSALF